MKKWILTLTALVMTLALAGTALAEESPDGLHASIQHVTDSPQSRNMDRSGSDNGRCCCLYRYRKDHDGHSEDRNDPAFIVFNSRLHFFSSPAAGAAPYHAFFMILRAAFSPASRGRCPPQTER